MQTHVPANRIIVLIPFAWDENKIFVVIEVYTAFLVQIVFASLDIICH